MNSQDFELRIFKNIDEIKEIVSFQSLIWPGDTTVPDHLLFTAVVNGGLLIGAYNKEELVGFVFGFIGLYENGVKHCSHMLGVHPNFRDHGVGYLLKKAQRQVVKHQGIDLITWTYDPLESRNANLNITKLGVVCNTYKTNLYGDMNDELNSGVPSDRFRVDWWINSSRVEKRMSGAARNALKIEQYTSAGALVVNSTKINDQNMPVPEKDDMDKLDNPKDRPPIVLFEFPSDFQRIKSTNMGLAQNWRLYSRVIFELLFNHGYYVTDFVFQKAEHPRSYYVLSQGESTLG